jgi:hypothetical protein
MKQGETFHLFPTARRSGWQVKPLPGDDLVVELAAIAAPGHDDRALVALVIGPGMRGRGVAG